ncbi:MAG: hypothetical protein A3H96_15130 [Acidobacteria bacterium RIFCSPLOWO2_02_FULL_67_36]|nr:MAG: hypothetical protein A3H96_15130 [Acidobacteria bacterium RIFCSPLOWO2_02_FULL_67_36]OFW19312.1 MAG: hypothetical protein A3G21_02335 [Acidobacteria bacterium RIFCSPLOWO2_12_FULL_66_21]
MKIFATVLACAALAVQSVPARPAPAAPAPARHLTIQSTTFRTTDGRLFAWRGITAFRLAAIVLRRHVFSIPESQPSRLLPRN